MKVEVIIDKPFAVPFSEIKIGEVFMDRGGWRYMRIGADPWNAVHLKSGMRDIFTDSTKVIPEKAKVVIE